MSLLEASTGRGGRSGQRQLLSSVKGLNGHESTKADGFMDYKDVAAELKAALHWSIYLFPVRYTPSTEESNNLEQLPRWAELDTSGREKVRSVLFEVYNAEQKKWKLKTLEFAGAKDIR